MDKALLKFFLIMGLVMLAACKKDIYVDNNLSQLNNGSLTNETFVIQVRSSQPSRISYTDNSDNHAEETEGGGSFSWEEGDQLLLLGEIEGFPYKTTRFSIMPDNIDQNYASFQGRLIEGATHYSVYYIREGHQLNVDEKNNVSVNYEAQTQVGNHATQHLRNYLSMAAHYSPHDITFTKEQLLLGGFTMRLQNSIIRFDLRNIPAEMNQPTSLIWQVKEGDMIKKQQTLHFEDVTPVEGQLTAYMCFEPFDMEISTGQTISIELCQEDKKIEYSKVTTRNIQYREGKRYFIEINFN